MNGTLADRIRRGFYVCYSEKVMQSCRFSMSAIPGSYKGVGGFFYAEGKARIRTSAQIPPWKIFYQSGFENGGHERVEVGFRQ